MTNKDDFFRLTFRRCEPEIQEFESNINNVCKGIGISRPLLVARLCNSLFEKGVEISFRSGEWSINTSKAVLASEISSSAELVNEKKDNINLSKASPASISADNISEVITMANDADMDEMLRAMGM